jgi:hypothetical protein
MTARSDHDAIEDVLLRYCYLVDVAREPRRLGEEVFTADAVDNHGVGPWRGREEIGEKQAEVIARFSGTAHVLTNVRIEVDGDTAHSHSYVTAWHWLAESEAGAPADFVVVGTYVDDLQRTPEGWRISYRRFRPLGRAVLAIGELPAYLQPVPRG